MVKTDWELRTEEDGTQVLTRYETPVLLWVLDRWFHIPDFIFDRIEWWLPATGRVTRIPCLLYSRWFPEVVMRRDWTRYDVVQRPGMANENAAVAQTPSETISTEISIAGDAPLFSSQWTVFRSSGQPTPGP